MSNSFMLDSAQTCEKWENIHQLLDCDHDGDGWADDTFLDEVQTSDCALAEEIINLNPAWILCILQII